MTVELTTIARVKALLMYGDSFADDDALTSLVQSVSQAIESYLNRGLEATSRTEVFDVALGQQSFQLEGWPVSTITSVKSATDWDFASATALDSTLYTFDASGIAYFSQSLSEGRQSLQVVYTGGLVADTAAVLASFPALADSCEKQVTHEWRRRDELAKGGRSEQGFSSTWSDVQLLESVKQRLQPYRRMSWL